MTMGRRKDERELVHLHVRIGSEQRRLVRRAALVLGVSESEVVRMALKEYFIMLNGIENFDN
jgi:hypothetical protein